MEQEEKSNSQLIVLPVHEDLKRDVEKMRAEIPMLVLERDNLRFVECRNIETAYMIAVGGLEYKVFESQCAMLRLKRKLEIIQAKYNRQETIIISTIDKILDEEFADYQQKLNDQIEKMNKAIKYGNAECLTKEETKELKKLYYAIVKAMHPDLHPGQTQAEKELFINAIMAYKNGDIATIRLIHTMYGELPLPNTNDDATKVLFKEKERLNNIINTIRDEISTIKSSFPYNMQEFLNDVEKVAAKKRELESLIKRNQEIANLYEERINEMVR